MEVQDPPPPQAKAPLDTGLHYTIACCKHGRALSRNQRRSRRRCFGLLRFEVIDLPIRVRGRVRVKVASGFSDLK